MKKIYRTGVFSHHPWEAENLSGPDQFSAPWTAPTQGLHPVSGPEKLLIHCPKGHFAPKFTNPILNSLFHFIPPPALQGKHY